MAGRHSRSSEWTKPRRLCSGLKPPFMSCASEAAVTILRLYPDGRDRPDGFAAAEMNGPFGEQPQTDRKSANPSSAKSADILLDRRDRLSHINELVVQVWQTSVVTR